MYLGRAASVYLSVSFVIPPKTATVMKELKILSRTETMARRKEAGREPYSSSRRAHYGRPQEERHGGTAQYLSLE